MYLPDYVIINVFIRKFSRTQQIFILDGQSS